MLECPICRQPYDGRVQVFVPPYSETFDTVECARRAAEIRGWGTNSAVSVIEFADARVLTRQERAAPQARRRIRGRESALAVGLGLFLAGAVTSIYLAARPSGKAETARVAAPTARKPTVARRPRVEHPRPAVATPRPPPRKIRRPAAKTVARPQKTLHPMRPISERLSYQARSFPIPLRIKPPDNSWAGAQWTSSHGRSAVGWASLARMPAENPKGVIAIETASGGTPSAEAVLARLRSAGGAAKFGRTTRTSIAGFQGWQTDGKVTGRFGHLFVPFGARSAAAPDSYRLERGERFRIVVLDVRGTRVVLFLESFRLPPKEFPAFLASANGILQSLQFPG